MYNYFFSEFGYGQKGYLVQETLINSIDADFFLIDGKRKPSTGTCMYTYITFLGGREQNMRCKRELFIAFFFTNMI